LPLASSRSSTPSWRATRTTSRSRWSGTAGSCVASSRALAVGARRDDGRRHRARAVRNACFAWARDGATGWRTRIKTLSLPFVWVFAASPARPRRLHASTSMSCSRTRQPHSHRDRPARRDSRDRFSRYGSIPGRTGARRADGRRRHQPRRGLGLERLGADDTVRWEDERVSAPVMAMARADELRKAPQYSRECATRQRDDPFRSR